MASTSYACERCRDIGIVPTRVRGDFDRPAHIEMPCGEDCRRPSDGLASYTLAIAAKRERAVRAGTLPPINDDERRQAKEGPVADSRLLDCARGRA